MPKSRLKTARRAGRIAAHGVCARARHPSVRTLRCMAMVSGVLLVAAFAAVVAGAVVTGVLLYRISRSSRAAEPPDA
jgi:hypothetical protein